MRNWITLVEQNNQPTLEWNDNEDCWSLDAFGFTADMLGAPEASLSIYQCQSETPGQGNAERALRWLRERCSHIVADDIGGEGTPSYLFCQRMVEKGLIDQALDDSGDEVHFEH